MSVIVPVSSCFDYCSFAVWSKDWEHDTFNSVLFSKDLLATRGVLWFHVNFRITYSGSVKNIMCFMIGIALNP